MAKAWVWVLVGVFAVIALVWISDYWYNYYTTGTCRDDHGNAYPCGKSYRYSDNYDYNFQSLCILLDFLFLTCLTPHMGQ